MRLLKAKFHNWCQHRDLTLNLADGLNAIRGPNGSGKSNILTGIVFGLTGDFSRNPGVKVDNIYQLAGEKERAGVSLELLHGATKLTIERNLRPNSQKLLIEGANHPITKADEINAKVQELLGVNERLLLDYVFVDQWKIFAFVDQSPGVRAKAFGELFNAAKADSIWKILGDFKIDVPIPAIDGDKVRVRIAENRFEIIQLQTELANYNHLTEKWNYDEDPLHNIVKQFERRQMLYNSIAQLGRKVADAEANLHTFDKLLKPLEEELATYQEIVKNTRVEAEQARIDLASWSAYETVHKARAMLENEIDQLKKERDARISPIKPDCYCGPIYYSHGEQLGNWRAELVAEQNFLSTFDPKNGTAACPMCGTSTAQLQNRLQGAYLKVPTLRNMISGLNDSIAKSRAYDEVVTNHVTGTSRLDTALHTAEVRLLNLTDAKHPTKDRDQLKQLVEDYVQIQVQISAAEKEINGLCREKARTEGEKSSLDGQLLNMRIELHSLRVTDEQAAVAKEQLEQKQDQFNTRNNLRFKLDTKLRVLNDDEATLHNFQLDERKAGKLRRLATHLDDVRGIFKELPQVAAQACLDSMVEETNDILEKFEAPFRVLNADNLRFTLRKHSGVTLTAERLSGGEKAVFALAFRIVVNSRFAGSLGLLCLDEPTAGLDEDNVACLEVALGRLRELSTSRGLQVVLITHETGLDGLFDRVIKLSPTH